MGHTGQRDYDKEIYHTSCIVTTILITNGKVGGAGSDLPIIHAQFTCKTHVPFFACDGCLQGAYRILVNMTSGGSRPLGEISANLFLSVSSITVPSWRCGFLFMT